MADKNFVVKNGLTVGNLTIDATTGNVTTLGAVVSSGIYTNEFFYANGAPYINAGYAGSQGPIGYTGSAGADGTIGVDGYTGSQGEIGYTGSAGADGVIGVDGYTGSQGDLGYTGSQGIIGGVTYNVTNNGTSTYVILGENNPAITLARGITYYFDINASGHPFWIKTAQTTGNLDAYTSGVTNNGVDIGVVTFTVPLDAPSTLYYICQFHASMVGTFTIRNIGELGYTGSQGDIGYTGSEGIQGNVGYTGSEGQQGIQGPIGYTGSAGTGGSGDGYTGSQGLPGVLASSQYIDAFTGNGIQTTFTLSVTPVDVYQTTVTIDGLTQLRSSYTLSNNSIIFSEAPANGDSIEVVSVLYGTTSFVTRTYTGDGNTTVYSVTNGVTVDGIIVTDNGLVQRPTTDYTVSGASIIFAEAPADQTVVQIRELPAGSVGYTGSIGYMGSSGLLTNWSSVTANYTATSGDRIIANTAGGSFNISLPVTPALGDYVKITDGYNFSTNAITVLNGGSTIEGQAVNVSINSAAVDVEFVYDGSTWQVISTLGPRGYTGSAGTGSTVEILSPFLLMGG